MIGTKVLQHLERMESKKALEHRMAGRMVAVNNTKAFVYEQGEGTPVLCFHGVPASSFLYRKVIAELAKQGFRGISFDLLGTGLSDRPVNFEYTWSNQGQWCVELVQQLGLNKFHIVLHDIGGPIGCEVIAQLPEQVLSVTILNTLLTNLDAFKKPFPMHFYESKGIGELMMRTTTGFLFHQLMRMRGVQNTSEFGIEDARAYLHFLNGNDKGRSFLKIMRSFEANAAKEALYIGALRELEVPMQLVWGVNDQALTLEAYGKPLQRALGLPSITELPGKHFLQEDCYEEIARLIVAQAQR